MRPPSCGSIDVAAEVRSFVVTVPAGTPSTAPLVSALSMPARVVDSIRVRVPPGPRGLVGWALAASGTPIVPWNAGAWMIQDDEITDWSLTGQITSGAWQLIAYNSGTYDHAIYLTFALDTPSSMTSAPGFVPLSIVA